VKKSTLCTLVIMMKKMDGPLRWAKCFGRILFGEHVNGEWIFLERWSTKPLLSLVQQGQNPKQLKMWMVTGAVSFHFKVPICDLWENGKFYDIYSSRDYICGLKH
jgi:hypothetical protein